MSAKHETAYPRFKSDVTDAELEEIYTPTADEIAFAQSQSGGSAEQLALLIQLKTVPRLGYFVKSYPIEAHMVHSDKSGNLAVIAVLFVEGKANKSLAEAWAHMPEKANEKKIYPPASRPRAFCLPTGTTIVTMAPSLHHLVPKAFGGLSHVLLHPNVRPVQAVNSRPVLQ